MALIASKIVDSTGSGMAAHYAFTSVKPGRYFLLSDWSLGSSNYLLVRADCYQIGRACEERSGQQRRAGGRMVRCRPPL